MQLLRLVFLIVMVVGPTVLLSTQAEAKCCACNPTCMPGNCSCCGCGLMVHVTDFNGDTGKGYLTVNGISQTIPFTAAPDVRGNLSKGLDAKLTLRPLPLDFKRGLKSLKFECLGVNETDYADRTTEFQFTYAVAKTLLEHGPQHDPEHARDGKK